MFVFTVLTFGYTRAPFIAKSLMQPLIKKWRELNILVTIFYDDGFSVSNCEKFLRKAALQIQCDLIRAGLVPGVDKCKWWPQKTIDWVGLRWNFELGGMSILPRRVEKVEARLNFCKTKLAKSNFQRCCEIFRTVGFYDASFTR